MKRGLNEGGRTAMLLAALTTGAGCMPIDVDDLRFPELVLDCPDSLTTRAFEGALPASTVDTLNQAGTLSAYPEAHCGALNMIGIEEDDDLQPKAATALASRLMAAIQDPAVSFDESAEYIEDSAGNPIVTFRGEPWKSEGIETLKAQLNITEDPEGSGEFVFAQAGTYQGIWATVLVADLDSEPPMQQAYIVTAHGGPGITTAGDLTEEQFYCTGQPVNWLPEEERLEVVTVNVRSTEPYGLNQPFPGYTLEGQAHAVSLANPDHIDLEGSRFNHPVDHPGICVEAQDLEAVN